MIPLHNYTDVPEYPHFLCSRMRASLMDTRRDAQDLIEMGMVF